MDGFDNNKLDKQMDSFGVKPAKIAKSNEQQGNCYCGKDRNLNIVELLCASCSRWFHESCIGYQLGKLVPFMMNYVFVCKNCSSTGLENFKKNQASFPQMCVTAIANLQQESVKDGSNKLQFSKDQEIIPFIDQYWEAMTTMPRRVTQSWYLTVQRALIKDVRALFTYEESAATGPMFGLVRPEPAAVRPNYDALARAGGAANNKSRTKRRGPGEGRRPRAGAADAPPAPRIPLHGYPPDHPFNKDGYRYILAEPDPHAPFRQEFDESNEWSGKPIPGWLYRALCPSSVLLALHDRAPQLKIAEDRLAVTGERGYCMVRATHAVAKGGWYWEATMEEMPEGAATRLGWGRCYANLQAPLGYDKFGYSWRSRKGTRFHESRGKHYSSGYGEGDVLGFLITLPEVHTAEHIPNTYKDRPLVKFKSHLYYEDKDNVQECINNLKPQNGSKMIFFKNGECQGVAFTDMYKGSYYPSLSLHKSVTVSVNFGPNFKHPPDSSKYQYKGMYEKAEEAISEQMMADMLYLTENEGRLRLDNFNI